jgi:hypothetical protein
MRANKDRPTLVQAEKAMRETFEAFLAHPDQDNASALYGRACDDYRNAWLREQGAPVAAPPATLSRHATETLDEQ